MEQIDETVELRRLDSAASWITGQLIKGIMRRR